MTAAALITAFVVATVPLVPTEPVLVGLGVLAASEHTVPVTVIIVGAIGCALSDHILYVVGRIAGGRGMAWLVRKPAGVAAHAWLTRSIARWGASVLVAGRWLPAGGTAGAVLAGASAWRLRRFSPASIAGSTLWAAYATLLGYFGGAVTRQPVTGFLLSLGIATGLTLLTSLLVRRPRTSAPPPKASADANS
ncbi:MAG TPA: VTT domain-containing protein [Pseudonocardiaceae bacterium]|jgi:membrane protein DedA with SNARE-associated domain|nr:VTT domain-containing protein [Pseudonocardiaceae bacterium]